MSEYTPSTEQVRDFWASNNASQATAEGYNFVGDREDFDRWLAQRRHEEEARLDAFDRWLESVKVEAVEAERKLMVRAIEDSMNKDAPAPNKAWAPETYYYEGMLVATEIIRGKR